ncbi:MAG: LuxR C-terminal-related transcriptional regulator [Thermomicrobiales bacterium]
MAANPVHVIRDPVRFPPLPAPLTRFIGRDTDVRALAGAVRAGDSRVLTLTGPGGVGKTRLALQVAAELDDVFAGMVAFVPLTAVQDPSLVLPAIAQTLVSDESAEWVAVDRIAGALQERRALLLLDNMEQVTAAGPDLVALLNRCHNLSLLVTSRLPLRVTGEHLYRVAPLAMPAAEAGDAWGPAELEALERTESVVLLLERAGRTQPPLKLTEQVAADIVAICNQTDGLPLAIELAAARLRVLTPRQIATRLRAPLQLLDYGPVDQPQRLQSMRQAVAWSYELLSPRQQRLLRWLSVFAGGFGATAVEAMARAASSDAAEDPGALNDLTALIDASLVQRVADAAGEARYTLLETIRAFGLEELTRTGDLDAARGAHLAWCLVFAEPAGAELAGPDHVYWWNRMAVEVGNVRAAFGWVFDQNDAGSAMRLGVAMSWFWSAPAFHEEALRVMRRVIAMPGARAMPAELAAALGVAAGLEHWVRNLDRAAGLAGEQLALCRTLSDRAGVIAALRGLGSIAIDREDLDTAQARLEEAWELSKLEPPAWDGAAIINLLGVVAFARGEYAAAAKLADEAETIWAELDAIGHVAAARINLARALVELGDFERGAAVLQSVLAVVDVDVGDDALVLHGFEIAAATAIHGGDAEAGGRLVGAALAMARRLRHHPRPGMREFRDRLQATLTVILGDAAYARAIEAGAALSLVEMLALARSVVERSTLGEGEGGPRASGAQVLTPREREVLRLVGDGLSDKEIAIALGMARNTASIHVRRLREKLGAPSRTALAALAIRQRLI